MSSATAKKFPGLHAYKSNKGNSIQSTSAFLILEKWETLIHSRAAFETTDD